MSTTKHNTGIQTSMSAEAYELIQCFYDGVDVVVRELAERIALERGSFLDDTKSVVAIEKEDVEQAGRRVINALKSLIQDDETITEQIKQIKSSIEDEDMEDMDDCFHSPAP